MVGETVEKGGRQDRIPEDLAPAGLPRKSGESAPRGHRPQRGGSRGGMGGWGHVGPDEGHTFIAGGCVSAPAGDTGAPGRILRRS